MHMANGNKGSRDLSAHKLLKIKEKVTLEDDMLHLIPYW